eukprot:2976116-Ditylum_brightwellii.AAC.1
MRANQSSTPRLHEMSKEVSNAAEDKQAEVTSNIARAAASQDGQSNLPIPSTAPKLQSTGVEVSAKSSDDTSARAIDMDKSSDNELRRSPRLAHAKSLSTVKESEGDTSNESEQPHMDDAEDRYVYDAMNPVVSMLMAGADPIKAPTFAQFKAMSPEEQAPWREALQKEYDELQRLGTFKP